jgi:hypothetical protein
MSWDLVYRSKPQKAQGPSLRIPPAVPERPQQAGPVTYSILMNLGRLDQVDRKKIDPAVEALLVWSTNLRLTRIGDPEHKGAFDWRAHAGFERAVRE